MRERKSIAVVGGNGRAHGRLSFGSCGHQITLWERGQAFGGQAAAFSVGDGMLEHFYHHLFQSDTDIVALMDELGIGDRLLWLPSNVGYFADGKLWPLNGAKDLLNLGFLPVRDRVRVGMVTAYLQKVTDWKKFESITAEDWLRNAMGDTAYAATFGATTQREIWPLCVRDCDGLVLGEDPAPDHLTPISGREGVSRLPDRELQRNRRCVGRSESRAWC